MYNLFLVYFVSFYMSRVYLSPSVVLFVSNQDNRQSPKTNNKYQMMYTYICAS